MANHNTPKRTYATPVQPKGFKQLPLCQKIMTVLLWIVVGTLLLITLVGCSGKQKLTENIAYRHDTTVVTIRKVDTLIYNAPDTATQRLLAECDEHGNALLSIIDDLNGKRTDISTQIKYITVKDTAGMVRRDALISIEAIAEGFANKVSILETQIQQGNTEKEEIRTELKKEKSKWYVWLIMGIAVGMFGACLVRLVLK